MKRSLKESKFVLVTVSEITEACNRWSSFIITKGRLHYRIPKYLWRPTSHCIALAKICIKFKLHLSAVLSITQTCVSVQSLRLVDQRLKVLLVHCQFNLYCLGLIVMIIRGLWPFLHLSGKVTFLCPKIGKFLLPD